MRLHTGPLVCRILQRGNQQMEGPLLDKSQKSLPFLQDSNLTRQIHFPAEFSSNPDQTPLPCLEDLDASLRKLNSRLFVIRGQPTDVFPRLFKEWKITRLSYEYDSEPFGKDRDAAIKKLATEAGVEVSVRISHTLYDLDKDGGAGPSSVDNIQEGTNITVHPSPASSQPDFLPFPASCAQQSVNIVQPQPGYSGSGMVGQVHKQSQRGRGISTVKRHNEDRASDSASKIQRHDSN